MDYVFKNIELASTHNWIVDTGYPQQLKCISCSIKARLWYGYYCYLDEYGFETTNKEVEKLLTCNNYLIKKVL
jgi:hypothetical protein